MYRTSASLFIAILCLAHNAVSQENTSLNVAREAYSQLDYEQAIRSARVVLGQNISSSERATAYELLALSFGALDSTSQAVDAFRELILIDPDREPDPIRVSPRITALYANAMGQVLVVRGVRIDSVSFVAGQGFIHIEFELPRLASVTIEAVGGGLEFDVDSLTVAGNARVNWRAVTLDGEPIPAGRYQIFIEAAAGADRYEAQTVIEISHAAVDTVAHLTSLPGRQEQDEVYQPGRNWKPLGIATLYTAVAAGASLALENTDLANPPRTEIAAVSFAALVTGLVMSLKKPDPVPVESAILYNQLLRDELTKQNLEIAADNVQRRRQTMLTAVAEARGTS